MNYLEALGLTHETLRPANYCEIGCRLGHSLALSTAPAIGVDPNYEIKVALATPTRLFNTTSDSFFAQDDVAQTLGAPIDLAFIDGLHLVEFALRDFMIWRSMPLRIASLRLTTSCRSTWTTHHAETKYQNLDR